MADEQNNDDEQDELEGQEQAPSRKKRLLILGGGFLSVVATAYLTAVMAVPGEREDRHFGGPFVAPLSAQALQVNLNGDGHKRFLVMELVAEFMAYDETYLAKRIEDSHFNALLEDALLGVASTKRASEVLDPALSLVFLEEIREAVDPLLFPVHVGDATTPTGRDAQTGLRGGESIFESTLRGAHDEHVLRIDAVQKQLRLDEGPIVTFEGDEIDLEVPNEDGAVVWLDVTRLEPEYVGEIEIGSHGRVRRILKKSFLVQ